MQRLGGEPLALIVGKHAGRALVRGKRQPKVEPPGDPGPVHDRLKIAQAFAEGKSPTRN